MHVAAVPLSFLFSNCSSPFVKKHFWCFCFSLLFLKIFFFQFLLLLVFFFFFAFFSKLTKRHAATWPYNYQHCTKMPTKSALLSASPVCSIFFLFFSLFFISILLIFPFFFFFFPLFQSPAKQQATTTTPSPPPQSIAQDADIVEITTEDVKPKPPANLPGKRPDPEPLSEEEINERSFTYLVENVPDREARKVRFKLFSTPSLLTPLVERRHHQTLPTSPRPHRPLSPFH